MAQDPEQEVDKGVQAGTYHPKDPPFQPMFEREEAVGILKLYIKDCIQNEGGGTDGKFPLLGISGMMGIGKSALLWYGVRRVVPDIVNEEPTLRARAAYLTFSGRGNLVGAFRKAYRAQGSASYSDAFGCALLISCGVEYKAAMQLVFPQSLRLYRKMLNMSDDESLVLMVDEIGALDKSRSRDGQLDEQSTLTELLSELMSEMDAADGKLVFVFAHVWHQVFKQQTPSGREIKALPLPPLSINVWQKVPEHRASDLSPAAAKHPGLFQLLHSCCGHPRSVFDRMDQALRNCGSLLTAPAPMHLRAARREMIELCKFDGLSDDVLNEMVPRWFSVIDRFRSLREQACSSPLGMRVVERTWSFSIPWCCRVGHQEILMSRWPIT